MNACAVVEASDPAWEQALGRVRHDVFARPDYHAACAPGSGGRALCLVAEHDGGVLVHPFLVRPISDEALGEAGWSDIESVYGYSGPLGTASSGAWEWFAEWCRERSVLAEFTRFNPVLANEALAPPGTETQQVRTSVFASLAGGPGAIWERYEGRQRTAVRKAEREGFAVRVVPAAEAMDAFLTLYVETMSRIGATPDYYFDDGYYKGLAALPYAYVWLVERDGEPGAAAVTLVAEDLRLVHYHLAGSTEEGRRAGAGNLLLHGLLLWAAERGAERVHLGGGRTAEPDDSLLRFKLSLARNQQPVIVGKLVRVPEAYSRLRARWEKRHGQTPFFLFHRTSLSKPARTCGSG